jgi:hypothetical protein
MSSSAAELRRHAEHCRYLADLTASPQDRQVLRQSADDFDAEAKRVDGKRRAAAERRESKG